jgi:hypothetical protein
MAYGDVMLYMIVVPIDTPSSGRIRAILLEF